MFHVPIFFQLVLFLRHYSLKRVVIRAEDVEKGEPSVQGLNGEKEERANEPANDNGDDDTETAIVNVEA